MSFFPILSADMYVAHIEILETITTTTGLEKLNLGAILSDSGQLLSISSNQIICPQGYEYLCFGNVKMSVGGAGGNAATVSFALDNTIIGVYGFWFSSYVGYNYTTDAMAYFKTSAASALLDLRDNSSTIAFTVPYNSATATIPNSSITILYKAL